MPNGNFVLSDLDFEKRIADMQDRQLLEFVARQSYDTCIKIDKHNLRIVSLENQSKKISGIAGAITGLVAAIIVSIINWLIRN